MDGGGPAQLAPPQRIREDAKRWYFTPDLLENTPSVQCGIPIEKELSYRQQAANFIQDMGQRLKVTQLCINTAIVYMQRFYMFHSFNRFHRNTIAAASLFLAAKVEEQPRKLEHVIKVAHICLHRDQPQLDSRSEAYMEQAQELVTNENILLQTLGFDVAIDHPHTHVVRCCQLVKASKELAQTSYFMATNSLHLTTMCLRYSPTIVACVCIHLACKWSNYKIPMSAQNREWFTYVDPTATLELLEQLTEEFLKIFDQCPSRLKKKIMASTQATKEEEERRQKADIAATQYQPDYSVRQEVPASNSVPVIGPTGSHGTQKPHSKPGHPQGHHPPGSHALGGNPPKPMSSGSQGQVGSNGSRPHHHSQQNQQQQQQHHHHHHHHHNHHQQTQQLQQSASASSSSQMSSSGGGGHQRRDPHVQGDKHQGRPVPHGVGTQQQSSASRHHHHQQQQQAGVSEDPKKTEAMNYEEYKRKRAPSSSSSSSGHRPMPHQQQHQPVPPHQSHQQHQQAGRHSKEPSAVPAGFAQKQLPPQVPAMGMSGNSNKHHQQQQQQLLAHSVPGGKHPTTSSSFNSASNPVAAAWSQRAAINKEPLGAGTTTTTSHSSGNPTASMASASKKQQQQQLQLQAPGKISSIFDIDPSPPRQSTVNTVVQPAATMAGSGASATAAKSGSSYNTNEASRDSIEPGEIADDTPPPSAGFSIDHSVVHPGKGFSTAPAAAATSLQQRLFGTFPAGDMMKGSGVSQVGSKPISPRRDASKKDHHHQKQQQVHHNHHHHHHHNNHHSQQSRPNHQSKKSLFSPPSDSETTTCNTTAPQEAIVEPQFHYGSKNTGQKSYGGVGGPGDLSAAPMFENLQRKQRTQQDQPPFGSSVPRAESYDKLASRDVVVPLRSAPPADPAALDGLKGGEVAALLGNDKQSIPKLNIHLGSSTLSLSTPADDQESSSSSSKKKHKKDKKSKKDKKQRDRDGEGETTAPLSSSASVPPLLSTFQQGHYQGLPNNPPAVAAGFPASPEAIVHKKHKKHREKDKHRDKEAMEKLQQPQQVSALAAANGGGGSFEDQGGLSGVNKHHRKEHHHNNHHDNHHHRHRSQHQHSSGNAAAIPQQQPQQSLLLLNQPQQQPHLGQVVGSSPVAASPGIPKIKIKLGQPPPPSSAVSSNPTTSLKISLDRKRPRDPSEDNLSNPATKMSRVLGTTPEAEHLYLSKKVK